MIRIDYDEAERRFDELLERTYRGEDFEIMRDGKPVARMLRPHPRQALPPGDDVATR
jgi:antitoxin (DNA-binding transcriptional repressor) of toxin-antitoxin stability system